MEEIERDNGLGISRVRGPGGHCEECSSGGDWGIPSRTDLIHYNWWRCHQEQRRKTVTMYSQNGDQYRARYQIIDRPLNSVCRICDQGNNVLFTQTRGWIINHETGRYTWFPREHREYVNTTPNHAHLTLPHTWIFLAWLKTWVIESGSVVSH